SCSRYFFLFRADFHLSGVHSFPTRRSSDLVRGVDGLPTWTRRAVDIHADFRIGDLNRVSLFHDGQNLDLGEGSLTAVLVIKGRLDRKSTRLNSSHVSISYAVFCLKKKKH